MARQTFVLVLGICGITGCASQKAAPEPETGPPGVDIEYRDRDEDADSSDAKATDTQDSEATASQAGEKAEREASPKDEPEAKPAPEKRSCDGLKKPTCEVTVGCAWSSDKKCVSQ